MAKMIYRKDTGEILGVHIFGLHAADLIHEASNAVATRQTVSVRSLLRAPAKTLFATSCCLVLRCTSLCLWSLWRECNAGWHCCTAPVWNAGALKVKCPAGHQVQRACAPHAVRGPG